MERPCKAYGPDAIHPRILRELASELASVVSHIFNTSLQSGEIPEDWSMANIFFYFITKLEKAPFTSSLKNEI